VRFEKPQPFVISSVRYDILIGLRNKKFLCVKACGVRLPSGMLHCSMPVRALTFAVARRRAPIVRAATAAHDPRSIVVRAVWPKARAEATRRAECARR